MFLSRFSLVSKRWATNVFSCQKSIEIDTEVFLDDMAQEEHGVSKQQYFTTLLAQHLLERPQLFRESFEKLCHLSIPLDEDIGAILLDVSSSRLKFAYLESLTLFNDDWGSTELTDDYVEFLLSLKAPKLTTFTARPSRHVIPKYTAPWELQNSFIHALSESVAASLQHAHFLMPVSDHEGEPFDFVKLFPNLESLALGRCS